MLLAAAPLGLDGLDGLTVPDLAIFVGGDERPLRGLAGFADWRMCGELTRLVKDGRFTGAAGEALLTVPAGRLPVERIFLFGVGAGLRAEALGESLAAVARAGGRRLATSLPDGAELVRALVQGAREAGLEELVLLHPDVRAADRALAVAADGVPGVRFAER